MLEDEPPPPMKKKGYRRDYVELARERVHEQLTHHKIHIVTAAPPHYVSYHCCHIKEDNTKRYDWGFFIVQTPGETMIRGDLRFCLWEATLESLARTIKDLEYVSQAVPPNIQIREPKKFRTVIDGQMTMQHRFTGEYMLQYWALRWFLERKERREYYHITRGMAHDDPTLALLPKQ